jgi:hypothetical protein
LRTQEPAELDPAGRQDRHIMTRRGYDRSNTAHACCRLPASHTGACPKCWKSAPIMHATLSANTLP